MDTQPLNKLLDLSNKVTIVTGGAVGIGKAIAIRLHEAGSYVVIADTNEEEGVSLTTQLNSVRADSTLFYRTDVGSAEQVSALMEKSIDVFGHIDILVNNAGVFPVVPVRQMDEQQFMHVINTNLKSVFLLSKQVANHMIDKNIKGSIVNITSVDALHPSMAGLAAYDASKHGVWGFTKNFALELAPFGIRVNAVAPGGVLTPGVQKMSTGESEEANITQAIPLGRMADPDEIARVTLFLASDMASYMTGSQVVVDGGRLLT